MSVFGMALPVRLFTRSAGGRQAEIWSSRKLVLQEVGNDRYLESDQGGGRNVHHETQRNGTLPSGHRYLEPSIREFASLTAPASTPVIA